MNDLINTFFGRKIEQKQMFDEKGKRIPVTVIEVSPCIITRILKKDKDGCDGFQLGIGTRKAKNTPKPILGQIKKAGIEKIPRFFRQVKLNKPLEETNSLKVGAEVKITDVFKKGDLVNVTGISKGRGFTGVVKRHHFKGGPRTHGQSDRERAPGSIGQTTTPGRVYKGKRMAGRSGNQKVTVKNLKIIDINEANHQVLIYGLIPGSRHSLVKITKV